MESARRIPISPDMETARETHCVITVTKQKALVLISECNENQIICQRTKKTFINSVADYGSSSVRRRAQILMTELFPNSDDKEYLEMSEDAKTLMKDKGIWKLMKVSWSQAQVKASRATTTQLQDKHTAHVELHFPE